MNKCVDKTIKPHRYFAMGLSFRMMSDEINNICTMRNANRCSYHARDDTKDLRKHVLQSLPHTKSHDNDAMQNRKKLQKSTKKRVA